jgi:lactoylglutathione lyase/glyoxylase I family protein
MIGRIAHVCLSVRDLEASKAFYGKLGFKPRFGFTHKGKPYGCYLEISPGNFIEMFEDKGRGVQSNPAVLHFCLECDDIDAACAMMDASGLSHTKKEMGCDGTWQVWLEDPDGNAFELHQYTTDSLQFSGGSVEASWL